MYQGLMGFVLVFFAASALAEDVYHWRDDGGQWHFGSEQSAPAYAKRFESTIPISVVETIVVMPSQVVMPSHREPASDVVTLPRKSRKKSTKRKSAPKSHESVAVEDRERHRDFCDRWREQLRRSRLGLHDHEGQSAYERECILKVHW